MNQQNYSLTPQNNSSTTLVTFLFLIRNTFLCILFQIHHTYINYTINMEKIKFGTDGWRAIIAQDFTVKNVARVAKGQADWLLKRYNKPVVVIGHDCRFGG